MQILAKIEGVRFSVLRLETVWVLQLKTLRVNNELCLVTVKSDSEKALKLGSTPQKFDGRPNFCTVAVDNIECSLDKLKMKMELSVTGVTISTSSTDRFLGGHIYMGEKCLCTQRKVTEWMWKKN